jgi:hypothetical protein
MRQAHRLPPRQWEQALFVIAIFVTLLAVVCPW